MVNHSDRLWPVCADSASTESDKNGMEIEMKIEKKTEEIRDILMQVGIEK